MKKCDCKSNVKPDRFPEVQAGDTVRISGEGDYIVCVHREGLRLNSLKRGTTWSYNSLWGYTLPPSEVTKIDLCYSE